MISERPSKIINSELFKMDEENLEKKDLKYVRQSMYRERRKLHPAQPENQAEFHSILDDIGVVTNKDDHFVLCNDSESGIILFGCEAYFYVQFQRKFLLMEHINVVLSISSNYIRYMALRMVITFPWSSVCYHRNQKPVTGKCFHYSMTAARDSTLICVLKQFI